ncbi:unnamed protein product [Brachionus calyciflorus]|uniref:Uncharacterized protein n=1 Tax=Brachionus calyciflorus TaxID=104777 RepID=A0A814L140_9BILA|nr:unnamed protein product [Brachionus calyciflorus]
MTFRIWNIQNEQCLISHKAHKNGINGFEIIDERRFISYAHNGEVKLWNEDKEQISFSNFDFDKSKITSFKILNSDEFVTGHENGMFTIWTNNT